MQKCKHGLTRIRIKGLIKALGLTQKEFAASIGIRHEAISRYLNGKSTPGLNTIMKIAEVYKIDPGWLMGYGDDSFIKGGRQ